MTVLHTSIGGVNIDRFWSRVDQWDDPDECWQWMGQKNTKGYGVFAVERKSKMAHRVAYVLCVGDIPEGLTLDHLCRVRGCVNPGHLEPVTVAENVRRGNSFTGINLRKTHCDHGHPFTPENTAITREGFRDCRECRRQISRRYSLRKKAAA